MDFNKGSMESQQIVELLLSMQTKMDANQERMETNRKAYQGEMMAVVDAYHERMMACLGKTEADTEKTEPDPGMMQSTEEHQKIPKKEASVMPVGEPRNRCRVRSLAAERRQKREERTQGNRGSRRKSASACRKVSRRAKVAWHKERSHEETSAEQGRWKEQTRNTFTNGNRKGWTFGKRRRVDPEGSTGVKDPNTGRHRRLKNEKTAGRIFEKTFRLQIAKREDGSSVGSLKIRDWTLWGGRSPPKRKKKN
jgi:hypothetical protein